jgi:glycosyltransferase involved in cell wall biosynthesis
MIWFFPERFSNGKPWSAQRKFMEWYYRLVPQLAVRHASAIITVSQAARESIIQHLGVEADKVWVTYEAPSHIYRPVDDAHQIEAVRQKYELASEFILAIGSADPRKNITTLVQAYALLPTTLRERYKLVIVWTHHFLATELANQVEQLGLTTRARFLKQVANEDLVLLYNAASLFVFPSLYEGFGLPPLEAMACGTPVVAANNSSIPEIVGDAALLVEAEDTEGLADMMAHVLTRETVQTSLAEKGLKQAARFSWEKCARQTMAGYHKSLLA